MSRVFVGTAGVGDHVEVALVGLCHYKVINDPSVLIGEERQRTLRGEEKRRRIGRSRDVKDDYKDLLYNMNYMNIPVSLDETLSLHINHILYSGLSMSQCREKKKEKKLKSIIYDHKLQVKVVILFSKLKFLVNQCIKRVSEDLIS